MFELKDSDLPELERLATGGYKWIARDESAQVCAFDAKPIRGTGMWGCGRGGGFRMLGINSALAISWSDPEPLNIAAAIAQIKAQTKHGAGYCRVDGDATIEVAETTSTPLTWNERINQMTVEEKATLFQHDDCFIYKLTGTAYCDRHLGCEECAKQFLSSPYTEGATK